MYYVKTITLSPASFTFLLLRRNKNTEVRHATCSWETRWSHTLSKLILIQVVVIRFDSDLVSFWFRRVMTLNSAFDSEIWFWFRGLGLFSFRGLQLDSDLGGGDWIHFCFRVLAGCKFILTDLLILGDLSSYDLIHF